MVSALLIVPSSAIASNLGTLHLDGLMIVRGEKHGTARVVITDMQTPGMALDNVSGHFTLDLGLGRSYLLSFEREGMVTKLVYFDTHVPQEELGRAFVFPFQVTLFEQGWNGVMAYAGPVGFVQYVLEKRDFVHRTDYRIVPGSPEEERMKELMRRRVGTAPRSWNTKPPAVRGELKFERHGKRNGLFVGKAYDAEGRLLAEGRFLDTGLKEMHGDFIYYHLNGKVESRGRFENGRKVGVWERFDTEGRPMAERVYGATALESGTTAGSAAAWPAKSVMDTTGEVASPGPNMVPDSRSLAPAHAATPISGKVPPRDAVPTVRTLPVTVMDVEEAPLSERSEELIVERQRVITVIRLPQRTGQVKEYRRVADRHGSVLYFEDGRSIPYSSFHAATGR
jgi:hypothetical protein